MERKRHTCKDERARETYNSGRTVKRERDVHARVQKSIKREKERERDGERRERSIWMAPRLSTQSRAPRNGQLNPLAYSEQRKRSCPLCPGETRRGNAMLGRFSFFFFLFSRGTGRGFLFDSRRRTNCRRFFLSARNFRRAEKEKGRKGGKRGKRRKIKYARRSLVTRREGRARCRACEDTSFCDEHGSKRRTSLVMMIMVTGRG